METTLQRNQLRISWALATILCAIFSFAGLPAAHGQGTIDGFGNTNVLMFLNGACEIPPNDSTNSGQAIFNYEPSNATNATCRVFLPLSFSNANSATINGPASPIGTAPVLFDLGQPEIVTNIFCISTWPEGITCTTNVRLACTSAFNITPEQLSDLKAGLWYINVKSTDYPQGEVRGQITQTPVLNNGRFQNGKFGFKVTTQPDGIYQIEASTNFTTWTTLTNLNVYISDSLFQAIDPDATNFPQRFYRVRRQ